MKLVHEHELSSIDPLHETYLRYILMLKNMRATKGAIPSMTVRARFM